MQSTPEHDPVCPQAQPCSKDLHHSGDYCATCGSCACTLIAWGRRDQHSIIFRAVRTVLTSHPGAGDPLMRQAVYDAIDGALPQMTAPQEDDQERRTSWQANPLGRPGRS